jgi:type IV pilus assembly protein PilK
MAMNEGHGMQPSGVWALKPSADMTAEEFHDWQALLERRTGQVLNEQRRSFLLTHLNSRMRELGIGDYQGYYQQLISGPRGAVEWSRLLDRLTVQETRFYRHLPSFELLDRYLQQHLAQKAAPWALWSMGCASGEEAYSLAIAAAEVERRTGHTQGFGVIATDISLGALAKAREGVFDPRRLQALEPELRDRYFTAEPRGQRIHPDLVARVCCARLNVLDLDLAPWTGMDVIFCQNLLIYFRRWRRRDILNRLAERLAPGGLLVVGVGEVSGWQHPDLEPVADEGVLAFTRKRL